MVRTPAHEGGAVKSGALPMGQWLTTTAPGVVARSGTRQWSRHQWQQQVTALGTRLLAHPGQRWALCFEDCYLFSVALLAALHAGKTPLIPGHCRPSLLAEQAAEFDGVLSDQTFLLDCPVWPVGEGQDAACGELPPIPQDAAVVLFTSGSTGTPRQVSKPVASLDEEARWLHALWGERLQGCTLIASVTHQHLYGLSFRLVLPMALGLPFDSRQVYYSEQLVSRPAGRYVFISSPAFLRRIDFSLEAPGCCLTVSAGGPLSWRDAQSVAQWTGSPVEEIYGSTETSAIASRTRSAEGAPWRPFSGVQFHQDAEHHWWVRSPLIPQAQGLMLDDKLAFSAQGFQLCGRYDRIVKIEDKRVSLSEIERRLLALPEVADAVALPVVRGDRSGIGVVLVLHQNGGDLSALKRQWRYELQRWLEPVAMPRFWRVVDTIPHNSQSKRAWPQIQELFYVAR
ncbi:AMP-binding protein [Erwinia sp. Eh17-17]|jgi:acyl-coenzyme A synthetase/AMP-(fatty) acid ligase|uniref:AMP-binding protein n=1 Tax=Erwinia sp. Eh17-17 TaxID=3080330 RepID=UPI00320A7B6E